jgi:hypothetical protein
VTGGLIGRFDGAILGYDVSPQWRVNVVGGVPIDTLVNTSQHFEGINVEAQNLWEHWGGDAFFMNQMADGVTDRRAIGGDLRYFDASRTLYGMLDYDVSFQQLNAGTLQGTWQLPDQTTISMLLDARKAPELLTSNAAISCNATSITELEQQGCTALGTQFAPPLTLDQVRQLSRLQTANSKQASLSVSRPFGERWQVSADVRLTNVGALPFIVVPSVVGGVSNTNPAQAGTGNVYTYDLQTSATNLYSKRDINSFTFSRLSGPQFTGNQFSYSNLTGLLKNRITVEPALRYYTEDDANGNHLSRISPSVRFTYKVLTHLSIESQILYERAKNEGVTQNDKTNNTFYYIGYRYDLQ